MKFFPLSRLIAAIWMLLSLGCALAGESPSELHDRSQPLRFGITPDTARGQYALLEEWRTYLQHKLDRPVEFIFRDTYRESMDLLREHKLDFAWLSTPAYLENRQQTNLLVSPLYRGRPFDRAYLIVPTSDHNSASLLSLKGRIFVYTDPASSTGYLAPRFQLRHAGEDPDRYFKKTFFTRDHQKVVAAVAIGLADGGSISGFAWETLALSRPDITAQTRIVTQSAEYGFPPIIARRTLDKHDFSEMQRILLGMSGEADGIKLLKRLNLDGFARADKTLYRSVEIMMQRVEQP